MGSPPIIRTTVDKSSGDTYVVVEGRRIGPGATPRQAIAVVSWLDLAWPELRSILRKGPHPAWLKRFMESQAEHLPKIRFEDTGDVTD